MEQERTRLREEEESGGKRGGGGGGGEGTEDETKSGLKILGMVRYC